MKKRLIALFLVFLTIFMLVPTVSGTDGICFIGLNDSVPMYLSAAEAPCYKGNALYVPYTVFRAGPAGIAVSYNADKGSLALFTRAKRLVYDLNAGTVTDEAQKVSNVEVVYRNGVVFVPVTRAANHFGFTATMLKSASGSPVLRLTDGGQQLDNSTFIRKAETLITIILEQEEKKSATKENEHTEGSKTETKTEGPATVYLAFAGDAVSMQTLDVLRKMQVSGAFFLTEQQIKENPSLVRQIFADGHQIGLTVNTQENVTEMLNAANVALDKVLFMKSLMALLPTGTQDVQGYLLLKDRGTSIDDILKGADTAQFYVCRTDASLVLQRLMQEKAYTPKLLETVRLPGVTGS